ncbi:hypothetical protein MKW92_002248 [Papaver armeniacum]|nr:hypothetical protein MKW92_002248 [Papaver armeniacum]
MVDAVVSFSVKRLGDALIGETVFLLDVCSQVKELRDELRRMQCFLKDADAKQQQGDERVRNWVADIRNVAYDAEDVIDAFILKIDATLKYGGIQKCFIRMALMVKNCKHLYSIGMKIHAIRSRLKVISDSRVTYGIDDLRGNEVNQIMQQQLRNHYPHVEDDDVIGLEEHTKTLLTELVKDDERRCIVSVVGVGGLGKTTLAKKIYKHDTIMSHFDCRAWSSVSQQLNLRDVLLKIIKKSMNPNDYELSEIKKLNDEDLLEKVYNYLKDKRYFVVVDDLWSFEDWNRLSPAFPNGKRGSKVLLTTRNKDVASRAAPHSFQLEPDLLNDEDSWELLCKKALPKNLNETNCHPADLKKIGTEMVRKCGGLPLAICVLGGILATKRSGVREWEYVNRDIPSNINQGKNGGVMGILALSYNDLPIHLKPCFLYLGLFPEDYAIPRKKLIRLWIAEGFIPHTNQDSRVTMEDLGKHHYLTELIQRCMIQVDKDFIPGKGKACRIHDLMRDLCLSKAKEMDFLDVYSHRNDGISNSLSTDTYRRLRRCAIHLNDKPMRYDFYFNNSTCALRTLLVISPMTTPLKYQNIKLLRVLDLENVRDFKTYITKEVCTLIHLRYLLLWVDQDAPILSSIDNLRNLQTLRLKYFRGILPDKITKLVELRHLNISLGVATEKLQLFEKLINLQTLKNIEAGAWIKKGCLEKLSRLRKLRVLNSSRMQTDALINEIVSNRSSSLSSSSDEQYHDSLKVLSIHSIDIFDDNIFGLLSCCRNLHRMQLWGRLNALNLLRYPPNLKKLKFYDSELKNDPMETLQYLPNLTFLMMKKAYTGEEMVCSAKGFPKLRFLYLYELKQLKKWRVDQGGMPCLKELYIHRSRELSMLPEGLRFISTLKKLEICGMQLIRDRVVRDVGEDWYKVQHIPSLVVID